MIRESRESNDDNKLGAFLKEISIEKRLALRDFAKISGISHSYINKLMIGVDTRTQKSISPTIGVLLKIADALEIPRLCGS